MVLHRSNNRPWRYQRCASCMKAQVCFLSVCEHVGGRKPLRNRRRLFAWHSACNAVKFSQTFSVKEMCVLVLTLSPLVLHCVSPPAWCRTPLTNLVVKSSLRIFLNPSLIILGPTKWTHLASKLNFDFCIVASCYAWHLLENDAKALNSTMAKYRCLFRLKYPPNVWNVPKLYTACFVEIVRSGGNQCVLHACCTECSALKP